MINPIYDQLFKACDSNIGELITYLHNTKSKEIADKILKEGFQFNAYLDYTTDVVTVQDPITIKYFTCVRQAYGGYTIIIQISRNLILQLSEQLEGKTNHYSEALTTSIPYLNDDKENVYLLSPYFIKGYLNGDKNIFIQNPLFNPFVSIDIFEDNITSILKSK